MNLPEKIQQARSELGLSRLDFGQLFGVTERTVYNWEKGETDFPVTLIDQLCKVTGKDISYFFPGSASNERPSTEELLEGLGRVWMDGELTLEQILDRLYMFREETKKRGLKP